MTPKFSGNFTCRKCEGNIGEAEEQEEKLTGEVETVGELLLLAHLINSKDVVFDEKIKFGTFGCRQCL